MASSGPDKGIAKIAKIAKIDDDDGCGDAKHDQDNQDFDQREAKRQSLTETSPVGAH